MKRQILLLEKPLFGVANAVAGSISPVRRSLDQAASELAKKARALALLGFQERAFIEYQRALARSPNDRAILMDAGQFAHEARLFPEAIRLFRKALDLSYRDPRAMRGLAFALHANGEIDEATYRYYRYLDANPLDYDALLNLSALFLDSARYEEAIDYANRALGVDKGKASPYYNIALANFNLGRFEEAENNIRHAIEIDPNAESYRLLGYFLETGEKHEEALVQYQRAVSKNPQFAEAWLDVARLNEKLGKPQEYLSHSQIALEMFQRNGGSAEEISRGYWNLGWAYYKNGDLQKSADASGKAVELVPESSPPRFNLGLALLLLGRPEEAKREYDVAVKHSRRSDIKADGIDDLQTALKKRPNIEGAQDILNKLLAEYSKIDVASPTRGLTHAQG
jgi:tetratricopeptide (TPR) repeat protein